MSQHTEILQILIAGSVPETSSKWRVQIYLPCTSEPRPTYTDGEEVKISTDIEIAGVNYVRLPTGLVLTYGIRKLPWTS